MRTNPPSPGSPAPTPTPDKRSLPLDRKLPLLILALLTVVLAASLWVSYYEIRVAAESSAGARLNSLSRVIASLVQQQVSARLATMHRVATDTAVVNSFADPTRAPSASTTKALAALAAPADSLTPPRLLTVDGQPLGGARLETADEAERFHTEIRSLAGSADTAHVGSWYVSHGHASFWIAVPVRSRGAIVGYLAQERRLNSNPRAVQPLRDLVGSDFELYFRNLAGSTWVDLTGASVPPPRHVAPAFAHLEQTTNADQTTSLAATTRVSGTPFAVTVEYPVMRVLAGPNATVRTLGAIAIVLVLIGSIIAWIISRQMTRPLVELTGAAEAIAEGEYTQRVRARGTDEIGRLGKAFNRMVEQVQVSSNASDEAVVHLTHSAATQEFLAEASRILAESLSDQTLLADLARYCVPSLADLCSIYVVEDDGTVRRVETANSTPDTARNVAALMPRRHTGPGIGGPRVADVIRSQKPLLLPRIDDAQARDPASDPAAALTGEMRATAFMCVPLIARGRALGAISFTMAHSGRTFTNDELDLAMELARRTAVAIDNAVIYRRSVQLRLEAEAASSAKSDFLAKMSHEIRTPINAMIGYAELLEMGISGPVTDAQSYQLGRIRASGEHLTSLVNEILDLAKIESGRMTVDPTVGSADEAVDAALSLVRPQATAKGVHAFNATEGAAALQYLGDPQRVQQILTNLLANAVKFTPTGGTVSVSTSVAKRPGQIGGAPLAGWISFTVRDSGIGISEDNLERIFQPFVQVENGYTRAHGGTGLGLTISRSLAFMMGGDLTVESTPGEGSAFTLLLPSPVPLPPV